MKRRLYPLGIVQSESGAHTGVIMAWEVQTPYPILKTLYEPAKRLKRDEGIKLLRRNISLIKENHRLKQENEALRRLLMEKRAQ